MIYTPRSLPPRPPLLLLFTLVHHRDGKLRQLFEEPNLFNQESPFQRGDLDIVSRAKTLRFDDDIMGWLEEEGNEARRRLTMMGGRGGREGRGERGVRRDRGDRDGALGGLGFGIEGGRGGRGGRGRQRKGGEGGTTGPDKMEGDKGKYNKNGDDDEKEEEEEEDEEDDDDDATIDPFSPLSFPSRVQRIFGAYSVEVVDALCTVARQAKSHGRTEADLQMAQDIAERAVYICEQAMLPVYHHSHVRALVVLGETVR